MTETTGYDLIIIGAGPGGYVAAIRASQLGFRVAVEPQGAFYIYADCSALTDDSFSFARRVLTEAHVAVTPGKDFGHNHPERHIRIAYTQPIARLEEALARIGRLVGKKP